MLAVGRRGNIKKILKKNLGLMAHKSLCSDNVIKV
jgi:hypothetical protein